MLDETSFWWGYVAGILTLAVVLLGIWWTDKT